VTITIPESTLVAIAAFLVGGEFATAALIILLVSFGHWDIRFRWLTPARAAGIRRGFKTTFWSVSGVVLANGASWAASWLVSAWHWDPTTASAAGLVLGGVFSGAHQVRTFTPADAPTPLAPDVPATPGGTP
jgi:hypothetical protein